MCTLMMCNENIPGILTAGLVLKQRRTCKHLLRYVFSKVKQKKIVV
jgi:hypothetical protein